MLVAQNSFFLLLNFAVYLVVTNEWSSPRHPTLRTERGAQMGTLRTKNAKIEVRGYAAFWVVCEQADKFLSSA